MFISILRIRIPLIYLWKNDQIRLSKNLTLHKNPFWPKPLILMALNNISAKMPNFTNLTFMHKSLWVLNSFQLNGNKNWKNHATSLTISLRIDQALCGWWITVHFLSDFLSSFDQADQSWGQESSCRRHPDSILQQ